MEQLLQGQSIEAEIDEQIVFNQLEDDTNAVWGLLLAAGYLKVLKLRTVEAHERGMGEEEGDVRYTFALTNYIHRIHIIYEERLQKFVVRYTYITPKPPFYHLAEHPLHSFG